MAVKRMTDHELAALFREHVKGYNMPSTFHTFTDSPFYDFAREVERRAITTGMMVQIDRAASDPGTASETPKDNPETGRTMVSRLWLILGWALGK